MNSPQLTDLPQLLEKCFDRRKFLIQEPHDQALRLFNGFTEGFPSLTVDLYGQTLLLMLHKVREEEAEQIARPALDKALDALPFITCAILKQRAASDPQLKAGRIVHGSNPDSAICESGVNYALDLLMNQDAGFYIDTRNLRAWLKSHSGGKTVLNAFAYTGSLGVAALAGGARQVTQIDRNGRFLKLAEKGAALNHLDAAKMTCKAVDFFVAVGQFKRSRVTFDTVIIDPPFFSITERGRVDLVNEAARLVNKARPLVKNGGRLIVVNNALFLGGREFMGVLEELGRGGYISIEEIIPVPEDFTGYDDTRSSSNLPSPAPFNHSTKITVLSITHKGSQNLEST